MFFYLLKKDISVCLWYKIQKIGEKYVQNFFFDMKHL